MSVNLSSQELISKGLVEEVRHTLARSGVPPTTLVLEMTERVIMSDTEVTINRLEQLRSSGCGCRSTTSAPVSRRSATCATSRSTP